MYISYISVHVLGDFFPKRAFHGGTFYQKMFLWGKFMGRGCCTWMNPTMLEYSLED